MSDKTLGFLLSGLEQRIDDLEAENLVLKNILINVINQLQPNQKGDVKLKTIERNMAMNALGNSTVANSSQKRQEVIDAVLSQVF
ncbi:hypothetical protein [Serratia fonticola]|uniref:hypothetical protein n=1 Tax=Serratia fonticola TaxID=47917 RepID=UPI003AB0CDE9